MEPIKLTPTPEYMGGIINESFALDVLGTDEYKTLSDILYTEAVFADGKQLIAPIEATLGALKALLEQRVQEAKSNKAKFDPKEYWRDPLWRKLEDQISKIFGFRTVDIEPLREKYIKEEDIFESKVINAYCFRNDRYPIDALVTDKGLYDKSHSLIFECLLTLGIIRALDPDEITAILLHELGHSIDPALVDINYTRVNIISKYLTDRRKDLTEKESRELQKAGKKYAAQGDGGDSGGAIAVGVAALGAMLIAAVISVWPKITEFFKNLFKSPEQAEKERLDKIKAEMEKDPEVFNRQNYCEAFADNIARMYGYGPALAKAWGKFRKDEAKKYSRIEKEKERQEAILETIIDMLKDSHKTEVHRLHALIKEYDADINNPNTPPRIKKQLEQDKKEIEAILNQFLNNRDEFQRKVYRLINSTLSKKDSDTEDTNK